MASNILPKPSETNEPVPAVARQKILNLNGTPRPKQTIAVFILIVILGGLALLISYIYDNTNNNDQNNSRKQDISYISDELSGYYVLYNYYPTLNYLNSPVFATFAVALDKNKFKDPTGSSELLSSRPVSGRYAYEPNPVGCNNLAIHCTGYKLIAILSEGNDYTIASKPSK